MLEMSLCSYPGPLPLLLSIVYLLCSPFTLGCWETHYKTKEACSRFRQLSNCFLVLGLMHTVFLMFFSPTGVQQQQKWGKKPHFAWSLMRAFLLDRIGLVLMHIKKLLSIFILICSSLKCTSDLFLFFPACSLSSLQCAWIHRRTWRGGNGQEKKAQTSSLSFFELFSTLAKILPQS